MKEKLKIYIERIRDGNTEELAEKLSPAFMEIEEQDVSFKSPIEVMGEAYVTDDFLLIRMSIKTEALLTCALCNEEFSFPIDIEDMVQEEPLEEIRDGVYDLLPLIRENILLAIPFYPQCGIDSCKHRSEIEPYLKKERPPEETSPFKDL